MNGIMNMIMFDCMVENEVVIGFVLVIVVVVKVVSVIGGVIVLVIVK